MSQLEQAYQVIKKPVVTEKATDQQAARNAYTFRVPLAANKVEIRQAVEKLFDVKVESVNTLRVIGKVKVRGRSIGRAQNWKKAMVALADGQTIDIF